MVIVVVVLTVLLMVVAEVTVACLSCVCWVETEASGVVPNEHIRLERLPVVLLVHRLEFADLGVPRVEVPDHGTDRATVRHKA